MDLDLDYLKELWAGQDGRCPLTGWELRLPDTANGWRSGKHPANASLDQINHGAGYTKGNVRFISVMANLSRGQFSDEQVLEFCRAVCAANAE